jgi:transcriptional regulator with XRE-family HTH domain
MEKNKKPKPIRESLAANVKARRRALDISQEELAELADISVQSVRAIEGQAAWLSDTMLGKLAHALKVLPFQLLVPADVTMDGAQIPEDSALITGILTNFRQNIQDDIDSRFSRIIEGRKP